MSVRLIQGGASEAFCLTAIDAESNRGIVARRAAERGLAAIERQK
jgi:hypothetical protein